MSNESLIWKAIDELNKEINKLSDLVSKIEALKTGTNLQIYSSCSGCGMVFNDSDNIKSIRDTDMCLVCDKNRNNG